MNRGNKGHKVYVGMSGGVDSSVSAALLKQAGFDVTGVFIKVWQPDWLECNWKEERLDAMRAAAHIGIPFVTLDLEKEYKEEVIDHMIAEYKAGRTPNPDVMCNRYVKFGAFLDWARSNGARFVATGHYAIVDADDAGNLKMLAGIDKNKDQSYFLWTLKQSDLEHILFPVGKYTKPEVRDLAKSFGLPNADKKDSQGLCFIGKVDFKEFLSHYIKPERGDVLDESGEVIGYHDGSVFLTIGERHGFTITKKSPNDLPFYIIDKDALQNSITVSNRALEKTPSNASKIARIGKVNWVSGSAPSDRPILKARSRYRQALQEMKIADVGIAQTVIEFAEPQDTLTPGQSLVIYDGEVCLGGGIIE